MNIKLPYIPHNWNEYINAERTNKYIANNIKQKEKQIIKFCVKEKYKDDYPVQITFKPHYSSFRQDLDNFRYKGLLDGLVSAEIIKNDNLKCIQKIIIEPVFDKEKCVEIEIKHLTNNNK